jgi:hypothetical protein
LKKCELVDIQLDEFLTLALNGGETQLHALADLFPGEVLRLFIGIGGCVNPSSGPDALEKKKAPPLGGGAVNCDFFDAPPAVNILSDLSGQIIIIIIIIIC